MEPTGPRHINLSYLSGFFDGEGCVLPDRIQVDNTNPYILEKYLVFFGGGTIALKKPKNNKMRACYRWSAYGEIGRNALREMMPYLMEKKEQALINLDILSHKRSSPERAELISKLKHLKRVNYDGYRQPSRVCRDRRHDKGTTEEAR